MNWQSVLTPWNIGGGLFGLLLAAAVIVSLVLHHRQIAAALLNVGQRLFSPVGFFGLVIVVFLIISVLESGEFFNIGITHGAIFGLLGYALALGFDLVSVVCMQAGLNATRMKDERGARLNLVGVGICAAVSAFANAAGSLRGYHPVDLDHTPTWMRLSAPWLGIVFPALIVVLSMTTDHILDHTPTSGINVDAFRARERKRVEMLQVRVETERELLTLEAELSTLRRTREQTRGRVPREWVWMHWLRPAVPVSSGLTGEVLSTAIEQTVQQASLALEKRFEDRHASRNLLKTGTAEAHMLQEQENASDTHWPRGTRASVPRSPAASSLLHTSAHRKHAPSQEGQGAEAISRTQPWDPQKTAERIQVALHHLGPGATNSEIARACGCSRTTVARWKKRFATQEQQTALAERTPSPLPQITEMAE